MQKATTEQLKCLRDASELLEQAISKIEASTWASGLKYSIRRDNDRLTSITERLENKIE